MKRILIYVAAIFFLTSSALRADEGMWLLSLLNKNFDEMKAKGLELTAEDIYNVNKSSLKDAIVGLSHERAQLGFFCTGEIISDQSLMLTNHHCGYEAIQKHSSVDHDYLKNGFWAKSLDEELLNEGLCATFLVRMEDVTDKVLEGITYATDDNERGSKISGKIKAIEKEAEKENDYTASVESVFDGNRFFLFVYETFRDVRLVGAPPESIGKFGGDTDNWMWPRHTGDFSLFRVYMSSEGKPADYSKDNIPYKPKHHLPVSIKGVKKDDFSMVMGFPGTTERYLSSYGIKEALEIKNPAAVKIRTKKLEMMRDGMDSDEKIRIQYAAKYAQTANYWKYFIGQSKGLKRLKVYDKKKSLEDEFTKWVSEDPERKKRYGEAISLIEKYYGGNKEKALANQYVFEALLQGGEVMMFPMQTVQFAQLLKNSPDQKELIKMMADELKVASAELFKDYNHDVDKNVAKELLKLYYEDVPKELQLKFINVKEKGKPKSGKEPKVTIDTLTFESVIESNFKGSIDLFTDHVFATSIFADEAKFNAFLAKPDHKTLTEDWAFKLMTAMFTEYFNALSGAGKDDLEKGRRLFVAGLMEMKKDKLFYPDANSTIRLTYGQVGDYEPADGVYYNYFTTLAGIMEKEDPSSLEFVVPEKLKDIYKNKDFGKYADEDGTMHVCFTTNNDITGGNSGSPVINGKGELIGTAFDGNWEAMSGDIAFEKNLQKCINCDIRYVLLVIEKIGGATNLIEEMDLVQ